MSKTLKKTSFFVIILAVLCVMSFALFFTTASTRVSAESFAVMTGEGYKSSYALGEELDIVKGKLTYGENTYENIEGIITTPSGKKHKTDSIVLNEKGIYTIEYKTSVEAGLGKRNISHALTFSVSGSIYTFDTNISSFSYGYDTSEYGMVGYTEGSENAQKALSVNITSGDTFYYGRPIDVSKMTENDRILKFALLPAVSGSAEVLTVRITLTDCHDPSNFVSFNFRNRYFNYGPSYSDVTGAAGRSSANESWSSPSADQIYYFDGTKHVERPLHLNRKEYFHNKAWLGISFNHSKKQLFTFNEGTDPYIPKIITDLKDPYFINTWGGFTTGECFLSITPMDYVGASCHLIISDIAGDSLEPVELKDNDKPSISIDYGSFENKANIPTAFVGCKYPVFSAKAFDVLSDVTCKVNLFKKVNAGLASYDADLSSGYFIPDEAGTYTLRYVAIDQMGNETVELVDITCLEDKTIKATLDGQGARSCRVGDTINIDNLSIEGQFGAVSTIVTANFAEESVVIRNGQFVPTKEGTYTIKYVVTDFCGQTDEVSYQLTTTTYNGPVLTPALNFEKYYLATHTYMLPEVTAYDYSANQSIPVSVFVIEDGVERDVTSGYVPKMTSDGTAKVYYMAGTEKSEEYDIVIVNPYAIEYDGEYEIKTIAFDKMFIVNNGVASATQNSVRITSNTSAESFSGEFARPVLVRNFKLEFSMLTSNANVNKISWTLTDAYNPSIAITFALVKQGKSVVFANGNGVTALPIDTSFADSENDCYSFNYSDLTRLITDNKKVRYTYSIDNNGNEFNGFPSGYAILSFNVEGVSADAEAVLNVLSINSQYLNIYHLDETNPLFYFESYKTRVAQDTVVSLPKFTAYDVVDNNVDVTVSVRANGQYVYSESGVRIRNLPYDDNIRFKLTEIAKYTIEYVVTDDSGNYITKRATIAVADTDGPEIEILGKSSASGKTIKIANAVAVDNLDGEIENVSVFIWYPNGWLENKFPGTDDKFIRPGENFKVEDSGTYKVVFYAVDAAGNTSYKIQTVVVK